MRSYTVCALTLVACCSAIRIAAASEAFDSGPRPYVSAIIRGAFASLSSGGVNTAGIAPAANVGTMTDDMLTAGGALGLAINRDHGLLRAEVEGRGREAMAVETPSVVSPFAYNVRAADGWSVTANLWRDLFLDDHWGVYVGGALGGGGYRMTVNDELSSGYGHVGSFAWQAGGGVTWRLADRVTLDLGYRWFAINTLSTSLALSD